MTRRISITLEPDELELLVRLRNMLEPGVTLTDFAGVLLVGAAEAEMHGIEGERNNLLQILSDWQPQGLSN